MKHFWVGITFVALITFGGGINLISHAEENESCIFFDPSGVGSCSNSFSSPIDAFIMIRNLSYPDGIAGWELKVEIDPGVFVVSSEIMGQGINIGQFPNMSVGLSTPIIPENSQIILAKISCFAIAEGGVSLGAVDNPSIPGATSPIFIRSSNSTLVETSLFWPEEGEDQVWFSYDCTEQISQQGVFLETYEIEEATSLTVDEGRLLDSAQDNYPSNKSELDWEHYMTISDFCFLGVVDTTKYWCYAAPTEGAQSVGIVRFIVTEPYWGVQGNFMVVDTRVDRPENCITYSREFFESFNAGEEYLVLGTARGERYKVLDGGAYRVLDGEFFSPSGKKEKNGIAVKDLLGIVTKKRNVYDMGRKADLICTVEVSGVDRSADIPVSRALVKKIWKGPGGQQTININLAYNYSPNIAGEYLIAPPLEEGNDYLVFLVNSAGGGFQSVDGMHSVFELRGNVLYTINGKRWGPLDLAAALTEAQ